MIEQPFLTFPSSPRRPPRFRVLPSVLVVALFVVGSVAGGLAGAAAVTSSRAPSTTASTTTTHATSTLATTTGAATTSTSLSATAIYQLDAPGVVTISTEVSNPLTGASGQGTGSGIVVDQQGDIVTNAHVVSGAQRIQVTFSNGQTVSATLRGLNQSADLAVVRVSVAASSLHPVTLGNSGAVSVGDTVYAIGSPFGLSGSMTTGIISAVNRSNPANSLSGLIQTDAAINPGNSGGPLLDAQGRLIGINDSIESPVDGNVGVGFAIPVNTVAQLLPSLEQ
jgi:S1-C subfamily serine protease